MVFFPNKAVTVYLETEDAVVCGVNGYGLPKTCLVQQGIVMGDFQPMSESEAKKEFGEVKQGTARLFLPYNYPITAEHKVKVDDVMYEVSGRPMNRSRLKSCKVLLEEEG